jgi:hypothetical protein
MIMHHAHDRDGPLDQGCNYRKVRHVVQVNQIRFEPVQHGLNHFHVAFARQCEALGESVPPRFLVSASGLAVEQRDSMAAGLEFFSCQLNVSFRSAELSEMLMNE